MCKKLHHGAQGAQLGAGAMLKFIMLALAAYRLARLVAKEEGPLSIFSEIRMAAGAYDLAENGQPATALGRGISCPHCVGMYAGGLLYVLSLHRWSKPLIVWLAVTGLQSWLTSVVAANEE